MRLTVVLLALALACASPSPLPAQDSAPYAGRPDSLKDPIQRRVPPLEVQVQVGFDHRSRGTLPGTWAPVSLWITNHTEKDLFGTLRVATVDSGGAPGGSKVSRPVAVPAGRRVQVNSTVFVGPGDSRLDVSVTTTSGEQASVTDSLLAAPRLMRSIVIVGEAKPDPTVISPTYPHDALAKVGHSFRMTGLPAVGLPVEDYGDSPDGARWQVLQALPESLPDRWIAYGGVSVVLITDPAVADAVTADQWTAITEFVRSGGHLVVEAGSPATAQALRASSRLGALMPARDGETRWIKAVDFHAVLNAPYSGDDQVVVTALRAKPEASATTIADVVVAATVDSGLGGLTVLGYSLAATAIAGYDNALRGFASAVCGWSARARPDFERQEGATNFLRQIDYELKSEELAQIPSHRVLLAFLLAYCLCIGPVNRIVFSSSRRPLRPWAVLPLIVLGFVGIALNQLGIKRPETPLLREITVLQARAGDTDALARSYLSLYSPSRATYRLDYPRKGTAVHYLTHTDHRGLDRDSLAFVDGVDRDQLDARDVTPMESAGAKVFRMDALALAPRSSTNLSATQRVPLDGTVTFSANAGARDSVTNGLKITLDGGLYISATGSQHELPAIRPGDTLAVANAGTVRGLQELISRTGRDRKVLEQLVQQLKLPQSRPALIAWTGSSLTGLRATSGAGTAQGAALTFFLFHPSKGDR